MKTKPLYKSQGGKEKIMTLYNKVLSQWPVPCEYITIPTQYGNTFVIASGDNAAPPLLLLHGSGSNSATWAYDVIEYSKHLRVYAVDIPGEPGNSAPNRFPCTGSAFAGWLDEVLDGLAVDNVILGGISLGAWASLKYAVYKPGRVNRLVAICPAGVYPLKFFISLRLIGWSLLGERGYDKVKHLLFKNEPVTKEAEDFLILTMKYFNYRTGAIPLFTDRELQRLTMPVLFLAGEGDIFIYPHKVAERLRKFVPDLTVTIFKEKGHAVINKASYVLSFLNQ
ncbi:MAG: alpha/beta hydrolase [Spirochaetales bacterium]|nr:alpha/beta hydrolase [Spirochaetales bacterium]